MFGYAPVIRTASIRRIAGHPTGAVRRCADVGGVDRRGPSHAGWIAGRRRGARDGAPRRDGRGDGCPASRGRSPRAHIDSCLYHGLAGVDFAERLAAEGARVRVPATLNVAALDLLHPGLVRLDEPPPGSRSAHDGRLRRDGMPAHLDVRALSARRPAGARRADRLGGVERDRLRELRARRPDRTVRRLPRHLLRDHREGAVRRTAHRRRGAARSRHPRRSTPCRRASCGRRPERPPSATSWEGSGGTAVAAIVGLPADIGEDGLKALGAASASSGSVALFHAVGVTPEAPTLEAAAGGVTDLPVSPSRSATCAGPATSSRRPRADSWAPSRWVRRTPPPPSSPDSSTWLTDDAPQSPST